MAEPTPTEAPPEAPPTPSATTVTPGREWRPMTSLGREIDRLFQEYLPWGPWRQALGGGAFEVEPSWQSPVSLGPAPIVNIVETERAYEIMAEAPGMDQSEIEVKFGNGVLKIKGEKKEERAEEQKQVHVSERRFGAFERSFRLPEGVDADKIEARLRNGVLLVVLPKTVEVQENEKTVPVKSAC